MFRFRHRPTAHTSAVVAFRRSLWLVLLLLVAFVLSLPAADAQSGKGFPALQRLAAGHHARVSALALDLRNGKVLWRRHAARALIPASLSKLYVAAASLRQWGPNKTFSTRLIADGRMHDGTLHGNLVLVGDGAPALSDMQLWQLAQRAREAGLRRVTGDLVINESKFGPMPCSGIDRCKAENASRHAYAAPLSAAGVNFNTWCLAIRPGQRPGSPARLGNCADAAGAPAIEGRIETGSASSRPHFSVIRASHRRRESLSVSGSVPAASSARRVYRAVAEPAVHTAVLLRQALHGAGIDVRGRDRASYASPSQAALLAKVDGQTLRLLLPQMLTYSNNFMADTLTLDLAAEAGAPTPLELSRAAGVLIRSNGHQAVPQTLANDAPPILLSGSGLSVGSRVSAANVAALLADMYGRTALFPSFLGALTVPMYSPFSFLNRSQGLWATHTAIKTGSLHHPVSVLATAGYARLDNGDWGAVAVIVNGTPDHPKLNVTGTMQAIQQDMNLLLSPAGQGKAPMRHGRSH